MKIQRWDELAEPSASEHKAFSWASAGKRRGNPGEQEEV